MDGSKTVIVLLNKDGSKNFILYNNKDRRKNSQVSASFRNNILTPIFLPNT
jgi:hypothetical protein